METDVMKPLSSSAQKVQVILDGFGPGFTVIEFDDSTRTAQEAADRVGCRLGQIVKSLIFSGKETGKGILVLTSGTNRVDENKIGQYSGEPIGRADADFVRSLTGFSIGGVPPVGHPQSIETYIDEDLMQYPFVVAAAGTPRAVFKCLPSDLVNMTRGKIMPIK
jgi:prolyl-tRNA editing enzyme YbaK/EbsC (Cys-tRNA(Pro) deacylase)